MFLNFNELQCKGNLIKSLYFFFYKILLRIKSINLFIFKISFCELFDLLPDILGGGGALIDGGGGALGKGELCEDKQDLCEDVASFSGKEDLFMEWRINKCLENSQNCFNFLS